MPASAADKDLLSELRERFERAQEADSPNRTEAMADIRFSSIPGNHWDAITKRERGDDRPMYEFDKLSISCKRVINDMRSNRPQGKVRGFEDGDKDTAEVYEGLCRNIWNCSDGDSVIDSAAEYQVRGGMGAWRVNTQYSDDTAFDQDIVLEAIRNPFCLWPDPTCQDALKRDAEYWILETRISKIAFERKYPKAKEVDWEGAEPGGDDWADETSVRICEYWWKEPKTVEMALLSDGSSVDLATVTPEQIQAAGLQVMRSRECQTFTIKQAICSGDAILEGPNDWAGKYFPFVLVYGEHLVVDGKPIWYGLVRKAKDAQRMYDYVRTAIAETIALAPQAKYWMTPKQSEGLMPLISEAHKKLYPVLPYNPDPLAPGPPQRVGGADVPVALIQEAQLASDEIKAVTGIFDASLGNRSNEQTGVAIKARQAQGEIANFNYMDNMAKGIRRTWEILIDLIPKIYDTTRSVRILGADGAEKYAKVNHQQPDGSVINDLSRGKYDVAITVGPSYATQRQEAVEAYTQIGQAQPQLYAVAGDIIFRNMDLPGAEQIAERLKAMLPPQIPQTLQDGKPVPPEVQQAMQQVQQMMQQVEQHGQLVQQASKEVEEKSGELDKQVSDLKVQQANFEATVARELAAIAQKEAELTLKEAQSTANQQSQDLENERTTLNNEIQQVLNGVQQQANDFMKSATDAVGQMQRAPITKIKRSVGPNGVEFIPEYGATQ